MKITVAVIQMEIFDGENGMLIPPGNREEVRQHESSRCAAGINLIYIVLKMLMSYAIKNRIMSCNCPQPSDI